MHILSRLKDNDNKFKTYKNDNQFSIHIEVDIGKLLSHSRLKNIYDDIFKKSKTFSWLTRTQIEKILLNIDKRPTKFFYNLMWHTKCIFHFDIIWYNTFFNEQPIPYWKIIWYIMIPYDINNKYHAVPINEGLLLRAIVVNWLLKIQVCINWYPRTTEWYVNWRETEKEYICEDWIDIAIHSIEAEREIYPLSWEQYNPNNQILIEDINDWIYWNFYNKSEINEDLANSEANKYFTSIKDYLNKRLSFYDNQWHILHKADKIKESNPQFYDAALWRWNKYVTIDLISHKWIWEKYSLSRYSRQSKQSN